MLLTSEITHDLWERCGQAIVDQHETIGERKLNPATRPEELRSILGQFNFESGRSPEEVVEFAIRGLRDFGVPTTHPRYYGLFNPSSGTMGWLADALVAGFNPQLAAWTHAPFANEVERHLIRAFGQKFGLEKADGTFCSGGAEANQTAVLCALVAKFPTYASHGTRSLNGNPRLYVSEQAHHSFIKAARFAGLGSDAVREVPVDSSFRLDAEALSRMIAADREKGDLPFMVVGTAGTTSGGLIDPLPAFNEIAKREELWFHTDAAWGGAAAMIPSLDGTLEGMERSDSITFDAHKFLSVPMGAGMFLTSHPDILGEACRITTDYMPRDGRSLDVDDPYSHSMQWSRRFIGLKLFMSLAHLGWDGYADVLAHQVEMGNELKRKLSAAGWEVVNDTPLPIACFRRSSSDSPDELMATVDRVVQSGEAWISFTRLRSDTPVIRACITHYGTQDSDLDALIQSLG